MFHTFQVDIASIPPPERFTYPFNYVPHALCIHAADEVKRYLGTRADWAEELGRGKMFGVLVVDDANGNRGFLAAFSGLLDGRNTHSYFVPPVFDYLSPTGYFKREEARISHIGWQMEDETDVEVRKRMGEERHQRSAALQQWLFRQFRMRNIMGEEKDLCEIFSVTPQQVPPSGAGECAEPKLLQYAFLHGCRPLAMATFWWGASPKSEIRRHGVFYPACKGRCEPILHHMLKGMDVAPDPMERKLNRQFGLELLYDDAFIAVVNKPAGMLSVPGNIKAPSVQSIMKERFPKIEGPMIVHRLDMSTSGIMLIVKTKAAHKLLQRQFLNREIEKRYVAILDGVVAPDKGVVSLPICPDIMDRPRQMVSYKYGKEAVTFYEVRKREGNMTWVDFYPQTGRTHQLRVHAAHPEGLNCPILGDELYGRPSTRLHLHAAYIRFVHPITLENMEIASPCPF